MTFLITFISWLIFNGKLTAQIVVVGLILAAGLQYFATHFLPQESERADGKKKDYVKRFPLYVKYIFILIWEIIKANIDVLKIAISPEVSFEPRIIYFTTDLKEESSRVLLANSITLTPGTITVSLKGDRFCVHCLDGRMGQGIEESVFVKQLHEIEERCYE